MSQERLLAEGVSPEQVRELQQHGFSFVDLLKLFAQFGRQNVLPILPELIPLIAAKDWAGVIALILKHKHPTPVPTP